MTACVSLFRGINVGGNRLVKMADLKAMHEILGLKNVTTYIQSGNVIFTTEDTNTVRLQKEIENAFEEKFGFHSHTLVRSALDLQEIVAKNPFQGQDDKEAKWIVVVFLANQPDTVAQESLLQSYSGPEQIFILGREMYIYYPEGMGRSKLTNTLLEKKLRTVGTARNWNTVLTLQEAVVSLSS